VQAENCENYWTDLVGQSFETVIDDVNYTVYFGDSVCGPCPSGIAVLSYKDVQVIDDVEYTAYIEIDYNYTTTYNVVAIEGLDFILFKGKLILLPDNPLILEIIEEE
jgi:hypothetical protein